MRGGDCRYRYPAYINLLSLPVLLQDFMSETVEIRRDEKAGLRTGCGVRSQVIDVLEAQIKGDRQ